MGNCYFQLLWKAQKGLRLSQELCTWKIPYQGRLFFHSRLRTDETVTTDISRTISLVNDQVHRWKPVTLNDPSPLEKVTCESPSLCQEQTSFCAAKIIIIYASQPRYQNQINIKRLCTSRQFPAMALARPCLFLPTDFSSDDSETGLNCMSLLRR